jgi:hypothetical protein
MFTAGKSTMTNSHLPHYQVSVNPAEYNRLMSSLTAMLGTSQLMVRNLRDNRIMTPEDMLTMHSTIQRCGWEVARLARAIAADPDSTESEYGIRPAS